VREKYAPFRGFLFEQAVHQPKGRVPTDQMEIEMQKPVKKQLLAVSVRTSLVAAVDTVAAREGFNPGRSLFVRR
jgi:hypothetical protein